MRSLNRRRGREHPGQRKSAPVIISMALLLLLSSTYGLSQGIGSGNRIEDRYKFIPIPYINYDRSLGFTLGAVPLFMFNPVEKDTVSPSSLIGGVATYSTSKTWIIMGFGMFFFDEDNWRITSGGGLGVLNYQFYLDNIISGWIPYESQADFAMVRVERKIYHKLYGGLTYIYANVVTSTDNLPLSDSLTLHGLGLNLSLDTRSSQYYPRSGYFTCIKYNTFPGWFGNERGSKKIEVNYNHYFSLRAGNDVLATRFYSGIGLGDLSFNQQFIVSHINIRGYTQGAYRGNYLLSLQGEYRWNFHRRWGAVGFAGVATVFEGINEDANGKLLPGIGTGIRFKAFEQTNFSVGLDVAAGIDDWGIYFQIGEAF